MIGAGALLLAMVAFTTDPLHDAVTAGNVAMAEKKYEEALAAYGKAASLAPDSTAVNLNLAGALYRTGHADQAFALYKRLGADETLPHAMQARLNGSAAAIVAGDAHRKQGDEEGAQRLYREAMGLASSYLGYRPDDDRARRNMELAKKRMEEPPPPPPEQEKRDETKDDQQDGNKDENEDSSEGEGDQEKQDQQGAPPPDQQENESSDQKKDDPRQGDGEKKDDQQEQDNPAEADNRSESEKSSEHGADPGDLTENQASSILRAVEADEQTLREQLRRERAEKYDTPPPGGKDW